MNVQEEILTAIKEYQTIIIHRHQRPDPDALGSQVGLAEILRASFPEKAIYQVGGPVEGLDYLAEMQEISDEVYKNALVIRPIPPIHQESVISAMPMVQN